MAITRINPPATPTSITATAVHGWDKVYQTESGSLVDRTSELTDPSTNIDSFAAQNDYIYFSVNIYDGYGQFVDIHVALATAASATISPTFEYSTGDDSWAPLTVVDNTAGFTVDGTITFTRASYPTNTQWKKATKDGSGNTIGDGTARFYVRVKRTATTLATPPKISECGTGVLTANKEYFYVMAGGSRNNMSYSSTAGRSDNRSAPTAEFSATTTTIKRSIKISFDRGTAERVIVWRTPASGLRSLYGTASSRGQLQTVAYIDNEIQTVNGAYFAEYSAVSGSEVVDNGMPLAYIYHSTYVFYNNYRRVQFLDVERGTITVNETTTTNFEDIWSECQSQGWTDALVKRHYQYATDDFQRRKIYHLNDNLDIKGLFSDTGVTLTFNSQIGTYNCTSATFGRRTGSTGGYGYDTGVDFILTADICFNPNIFFQNTKFYSCKFIQAAINESRIYAHFPVMQDNCELYDCMLDGYANFEAPSFDGDNLILNNVIISQTRYGL